MSQDEVLDAPTHADSSPSQALDDHGKCFRMCGRHAHFRIHFDVRNAEDKKRWKSLDPRICTPLHRSTWAWACRLVDERLAKEYCVNGARYQTQRELYTLLKDGRPYYMDIIVKGGVYDGRNIGSLAAENIRPADVVAAEVHAHGWRWGSSCRPCSEVALASQRSCKNVHCSKKDMPLEAVYGSWSKPYKMVACAYCGVTYSTSAAEGGHCEWGRSCDVCLCVYTRLLTSAEMPPESED